MRRSTKLVQAVQKALGELVADQPITAGVTLSEALAEYRKRPDGEPEVRKAKAKVEAKA